MKTPKHLTKQLRKLAKSETADAERTLRFQALLGRLRREGATVGAIEELQAILDDPEPDIRQGHADVDKLRNASPAERRWVLANLRQNVGKLTLCILVAFIAAYFLPIPLGAAVRARVRHFFDRIVGAPAESQPSRSAHGAISVIPPLDFQLLEQRIDARETAEFAHISSNIGSTCVDGSLQAFGQFLSVPNTPPFVVLRNNEILNTVDTVSNGEVTLRDYNVVANRAYSYKLAKLDPVTGEYHSSSPKSTRTPVKCRPDTATPVLDTSSVTPTEGGAPLTVTCHASAHGPDGEGIQYHWSFGGGEGLTTTRETITHTYKYRQDEVVSLTVLHDGGGVLPAAVQQPISITSGPRPPLLSQVEEYKQFGEGEAHPDGGPIGTLFHFRVFPRLSPVGARPVLYRWSFDECRRRFDSRSPDPMPPNADCASPRLSSPEYQRRFTVSGQYTAQVEVTYDDGEVDVVIVATVNVGLRERVWYNDNGGMARAGILVPAGVTDPDAYKPIKAPPEPPQ
jgi:chitodextrinase